MCKLDEILNTEQKPFLVPKQGKRGMSYDHIEYNTDLLFMFAKKIEKPLDEALGLLQDGKGKSLADSAYRRRALRSQKEIVDELCKVIA